MARKFSKKEIEAYQQKTGWNPRHEGCQLILDVLAGISVEEATSQMIKADNIRTKRDGVDAIGNKVTRD